MRQTIAQAISDALNDVLDDGYEPFGDGVDYENILVGTDNAPDGCVVISKLGDDFADYVVKVEWK